MQRVVIEEGIWVLHPSNEMLHHDIGHSIAFASFCPPCLYHFSENRHPSCGECIVRVQDVCTVARSVVLWSSWVEQNRIAAFKLIDQGRRQDSIDGKIPNVKFNAHRRVRSWIVHRRYLNGLHWAQYVVFLISRVVWPGPW